MDFKCGIDGVMMKKCVNLIKKDFFKTSCIDISKSGKYMVRSGLYKIFLTEFETNKRINAVKGYGYIINGISNNDKHCVFTSNGERRINILSIPDLKEIAFLDTDYVTNLKFFSDSEVMYFSKKFGAREYTLKIWNFLTGEIKTMFNNHNSDFAATTRYLVNDSMYLASCAEERINGRYVYEKGKYSIVCSNSLSEFSINGKYNFRSVSQPNNNRVLISKRTDDDKYIIGIHDLISESFTPISKRENFQLFLYWLSDDSFLFSEFENKNTSIMNLNGEITTLVDDCTHIAPCSNEKFLSCYNPCGTYLFEKVFETDQSGDGSMIEP